MIMIIKTKYFSGYSGFLHVVSKGKYSVVVISPDGKRCRTVLGKSDGINNPNAIHFDKVKSNLVVHFFFIKLNNRKRFIYTVKPGEVERKKNQLTKNEYIHCIY